jgi:hypothetical protein
MHGNVLAERTGVEREERLRLGGLPEFVRGAMHRLD